MIGFLIFYFTFSGVVMASCLFEEGDKWFGLLLCFLTGWFWFPIVLGLFLQKFKDM